MSDIRLDEAGIAWQHCPACGQEVIPSYNGWREHQPYCPANVGIEAAVARVEELDAATAQAKAERIRFVEMLEERRAEYIAKALGWPATDEAR